MVSRSHYIKVEMVYSGVECVTTSRQSYQTSYNITIQSHDHFLSTDHLRTVMGLNYRSHVQTQ
jgi:hypothetical protein